MARSGLAGALAAGLELLGGGLLLVGQARVVGGLALEALGLRAVLVGALEALLGGLPVSRARAALASSCWRWPLASVLRRSRARSRSTRRRTEAR